MAWIILGVVAFVVFYVLSVYNGLQTIKTRIEASIQEIGNQLKRQANLIPNLEESTKGYLKHEQGIFKSLTEARKAVITAAESGAGLPKLDAAVAKMQALLPKLQVIVESNPEIKADSIVVKLMDELRDTADKLMYARRTVIDLTQDFNVRLVTFPSNVVAGLFGFRKQAGIATPMTGEHVEVSAAETKDVKVKLS